jgi:hypothetical protein
MFLIYSIWNPPPPPNKFFFNIFRFSCSYRNGPYSSCTILSLWIWHNNVLFTVIEKLLSKSRGPVKFVYVKTGPTTTNDTATTTFQRKPEAATAVYKLLMMGKRMPETCWVVFERQAINLRDWFIWLVDLFECNSCFTCSVGREV